MIIAEDEIIYTVPLRLESNFDGISWLSEVAGDSISQIGEIIIIDFSKCEYFETNLCAVFGSIIVGLFKRQCKLWFTHPIDSVKNLLIANNFYHAFIPNDFPPGNIVESILYQSFEQDEELNFKQYIEQQLFRKLRTIRLSNPLKNKMAESIAEIYANAHFHGKCETVFCSGQFFKDEYLYLTIVDLGKTIKANVIEYLKKNKSGTEAIDWATSEKNTTKTDQPGGLGLKIIRDFINENQGIMQVVSSDGFWDLQHGILVKQKVETAFPGTIVTLGFNLEDQKSYYLAEEIMPANPF